MEQNIKVALFLNIQLDIGSRCIVLGYVCINFVLFASAGPDCCMRICRRVSLFTTRYKMFMYVRAKKEFYKTIVTTTTYSLPKNKTKDAFPVSYALIFMRSLQRATNNIII